MLEASCRRQNCGGRLLHEFAGGFCTNSRRLDRNRWEGYNKIEGILWENPGGRMLDSGIFIFEIPANDGK